ncbi:hypothetical protein C8J57DRAFT_1255939 [Mycena rebaudengoi]|nr:hypothetical protein C8J57DRAFT_1255939 [Mycena rebaudengoi]
MSTSTPPYAPPAIRAITAPLVTRTAPSIPCAEALYVPLAQRVLATASRTQRCRRTCSPRSASWRCMRRSTQHAALCALAEHPWTPHPVLLFLAATRTVLAALHALHAVLHDVFVIPFRDGACCATPHAASCAARRSQTSHIFLRDSPCRGAAAAVPLLVSDDPWLELLHGAELFVPKDAPRCDCMARGRSGFFAMCPRDAVRMCLASGRRAPSMLCPRVRGGSCRQLLSREARLRGVRAALWCTAAYELACGVGGDARLLGSRRARGSRHVPSRVGVGVGGWQRRGRQRIPQRDSPHARPILLVLPNILAE